jgi:hypothetical protein
VLVSGLTDRFEARLGRVFGLEYKKTGNARGSHMREYTREAFFEKGWWSWLLALLTCAGGGWTGVWKNAMEADPWMSGVKIYGICYLSGTFFSLFNA